MWEPCQTQNLIGSGIADFRRGEPCLHPQGVVPLDCVSEWGSFDGPERSIEVQGDHQLGEPEGGDQLSWIHVTATSTMHWQV
jgi:hypothetical protein